MFASRIALLGAAAFLAGTAAGFAQSPSAQNGRLIEVPPGAVVLVLPAGAVAGAMQPAAFPFPDMPSPVAMIRQMDQMMADMQQDVAPPQLGGQVAGVVVTSFSDGHGTCTRRITYRGDGSAPVVQVSATGGNACADAGLPAGAPAIEAPDHARPKLIQVRNQGRPITPPRAPLTFAQAGQ